MIAGADYGAERVAGVGPVWHLRLFRATRFWLLQHVVFLGTTLQASLSDWLVVQSSGLVGGGYVAAFSEDRSSRRNDDYGSLRKDSRTCG